MAEIKELFPDSEIWTDPGRMEPYSRDEALKSKDLPKAVIFPRTAAEVSKILQFANQQKLSVIPRGAGSGLSGGCVPDANSLVLSLERMNQILEVNTDERIAVVEPGVITGAIRNAAQAHNLFYPPIPASVDFCTIGGNVATNAGGLCAVKYGVTREYVMGLEVVLATGEIIQTGGRFLKNTTGYNLTQLMIGSEGTLGVVTKIILRLLPMPMHRVTLLVPFPTLEKITRAIVEIIKNGISTPTLELIPKEAVALVLARHPELTYPFPDETACLLMELDGRNESSIEKDLDDLESVLTQFQSQPPIVATTATQRDTLWNVRKLIRDSIANSGDFEEADSVVPRMQVPALMKSAHELASKHGLTVISYGHAGDGNLHTYFKRGNLPELEWKSRSTQALQGFFERTIELGGTISGEHGIGLLKRDYLPLALSNEQIDLMRRLKRAFDPNGILNPGKVFTL